MLPSHLSLLEALLDFYVEAGVDCALDEAAHDRFAEETRVLKESSLPERAGFAGARLRPEIDVPGKARASPHAPQRPAFAASSSADDAALAARARAREAKTLDELKTMLSR